MSKARQYKPSEIKRLFAFSGNECAEPTCQNKLIAKDGKTMIGRICHIEAANENGPRYRKEMSDSERRSIENLILLCDEHHRIIDNEENEDLYPVSLLKEWKHCHQKKFEESPAEVKDELVQNALNNIFEDLEILKKNASETKEKVNILLENSYITDNSIPIIDSILNCIRDDIDNLRLIESYSTLQKLEKALNVSEISNLKKNRLLAEIFYMKGQSVYYGDNCKEKSCDLYIKAHATLQSNIRYKEKACWCFLYENDLESANWIADQLLKNNPLNSIGNFIKSLNNSESYDIPPIVKNSLDFKRFKLMWKIVSSQRDKKPITDWDCIIGVLNSRDYENITISRELINFWRLIAFSIFLKAFSGPMTFRSNAEIKHSFSNLEFNRLNRIVGELYNYLSNYDALNIRLEYIEIDWLHKIVKFIETGSKEHIKKASIILKSLALDESTSHKAFITTFLCSITADWDLAIELSEKYELDNQSFIGPIRVISFLNLNKPEKAKEVSLKTIEEVKIIDDNSFYYLFEIICHFPSFNEDPFLHISNKINSLDNSKKELKDFLLAWSFYIGSRIRTTNVQFDFQQQVEKLSKIKWNSATKIWLAEMEAEGCKRYNVAKKYFEEILDSSPFNEDSNLWEKYFWIWYKSDESNERLLDLVRKRRKNHNQISLFSLEFSLLSFYRKYNELIKLCNECIPHFNKEYRYEFIFSLAALIASQAPNKYDRIKHLFNEELIDCNLRVDKKIKLSTILAECELLDIGLRMLYKEIKTNNSPLAKTQYLNLWSFDSNPSSLSNEYQRINSINSDCVVKLIDQKNNNSILLEISNSSIEKRELQGKLIGKKLGEVITHQKPIGGSIDFLIDEIYGKYLGLNFQIVDEVEKDSTTDIRLGVMKFNPDDIQETLSNMMEMAGGEKSFKEDNKRRLYLFESFKTRKISFMELVNSIDSKMMIEIYDDLTIGSNKEFPCLLVVNNSILLKKETKLVIDFTSLIPLFNLYNKYKVLPKNELICSQTIVDYLNRRIFELKNSSNIIGNVSFTNYGPRIAKLPKGYHIRKIDYFSEILNWIKKYCTVDFSFKTGDLLSRYINDNEIEDMNTELLPYFIDNITLSEKENFELLTDDYVYRKFLKKNVIPFQTLFFESFDSSTSNINDFLYDLLEVNYVGIIPGKDLFIETLIKGSISTNPHPLLKLIKGALLYKEGVLSLLSFIRELYIQPNILKSDRERIARIIFSEILSFNNDFPVKRKNVIKAKLSADFFLLQDSLPQVLEIFEEEWEIKKS